LAAFAVRQSASLAKEEGSELACLVLTIFTLDTSHFVVTRCAHFQPLIALHRNIRITPPVSSSLQASIWEIVTPPAPIVSKPSFDSTDSSAAAKQAMRKLEMAPGDDFHRALFLTLRTSAAQHETCDCIIYTISKKP